MGNVHDGVTIGRWTDADVLHASRLQQDYRDNPEDEQLAWLLVNVSAVPAVAERLDPELVQRARTLLGPATKDWAQVSCALNNVDCKSPLPADRKNGKPWKMDEMRARLDTYVSTPNNVLRTCVHEKLDSAAAWKFVLEELRKKIDNYRHAERLRGLHHENMDACYQLASFCERSLVFGPAPPELADLSKDYQAASVEGGGLCVSSGPGELKYELELCGQLSAFDVSGTWRGRKDTYLELHELLKHLLGPAGDTEDVTEEDSAPSPAKKKKAAWTKLDLRNKNFTVE